VAQLSVEEGICQDTGINLGDQLTYDVAGSRSTARVTSLRKLAMDSMRVNFFVIATPELLRDFPEAISAASICRPDRVRAADEAGAANSESAGDRYRAVIAQVAYYHRTKSRRRSAWCSCSRC